MENLTRCLQGHVVNGDDQTLVAVRNTCSSVDCEVKLKEYICWFEITLLKTIKTTSILWHLIFIWDINKNDSYNFLNKMQMMNKKYEMVNYKLCNWRAVFPSRQWFDDWPLHVDDLCVGKKNEIVYDDYYSETG